MDGAIHPGTAQQRGVGRVDDGLRVGAGDIANDDIEPSHKNTSILPLGSGLRFFQYTGPGGKNKGKS